MKAYKAYGTDGHVTADTPRNAALAFFAKYPSKRKCDVIEGTYDGLFFTITYGRRSEGKWPASWKDLTKKTANNLPEQA